MKKLSTRYLLPAALLLFCSVAAAEELDVTVNKVSKDGVGESIGTIHLKDSDEGLVIKPDLKGLVAGDHGFHIHDKPSCDAAINKDGALSPAEGAGGHFDPAKTGMHMGPKGMGHRGDLPILEVASDGTATKEVTAKNLTVDTIRGHAIMIHEGGDNYSDTPKPLGGGGTRVACGVILAK